MWQIKASESPANFLYVPRVNYQRKQFRSEQDTDCHEQLLRCEKHWEGGQRAGTSLPPPTGRQVCICLMSWRGECWCSEAIDGASGTDKPMQC